MSVFRGKMADLRRIAPKKGDSSVFQHKTCGGQTGSRRKTATNDHICDLAFGRSEKPTYLAKRTMK